MITYSSFIFFKPKFYVPQTQTSLIVGGSIAGFSAGIFGMRGAIRSMFLSAFNLPKEIYIATTGAISFMVDSARLYVYWEHGALLTLAWYWMLFIIIVSFVGAYIGRMILTYVPQHKFRIIIMIFLLLMGIRLIMMNLF